jgi:hypothetical protein
MASKMSSGTRLAARGLSLAINSQMRLCRTQGQDAAQNPVRHSFWIALIEKFILTLAQAVKESLAVDRLHSTALNVIVAPTKHFADFCHFCQIPGQGIFHEVVGRAALLEARSVKRDSVSGLMCTSMTVRLGTRIGSVKAIAARRRGHPFI